MFTDVPAIPTPTSVDMYREPSKCNRNHRLIPLSHEHNTSGITIFEEPFLPGLVCLTCKKCVAVYQPENKDNCRSSNQDNHYCNIEKILRSTNEKKAGLALKIIAERPVGNKDGPRSKFANMQSYKLRPPRVLASIGPVGWFKDGNM